MKYIVSVGVFMVAMAMWTQSVGAVCQNQPIIMYENPGCYWCEHARRQFVLHGVRWFERSAQANGFSFSPVFWVDGVWIQGYNREKLSRNLCVTFE